ncbi:hypothetical protein NPIL_29871, partial [Nephila pilipes]
EYPSCLGALPKQQSYSTMEEMESPPSYEKVVTDYGYQTNRAH